MRLRSTALIAATLRNHVEALTGIDVAKPGALLEGASPARNHKEN